MIWLISLQALLIIFLHTRSIFHMKLEATESLTQKKSVTRSRGLDRTGPEQKQSTWQWWSPDLLRVFHPKTATTIFMRWFFMGIEDQGLACAHTHTHFVGWSQRELWSHCVKDDGLEPPSYSTLHLIISGPYMEFSSPQAQRLSGATRADMLPCTTPRTKMLLVLKDDLSTNSMTNQCMSKRREPRDSDG